MIRTSDVIVVVNLLLRILSTTNGVALETCEVHEQLVADGNSCTRYHVCRQLEHTDEFTTDIAICAPGNVFDMVSSECVGSDTGFLQDPAGCTTFYGCHPTKETSEGFLRRRYTCPGQLRFNPTEKFCTFKTNVTDDLCNSRDPDQRIIGNFVHRRQEGHRKQVTVRSNNRASINLPPLGGSSQSSLLTRIAQSSLRRKEGSYAPKSPPPKPSGDSKTPTKGVHIPQTNLYRIAQEISGQLLSLHDKQKAPESKKEEKGGEKEVKTDSEKQIKKDN